MAMLGLAGYAFLRHRRKKHTAPDASRNDFEIDPLDSVQSFEKISDLEVADLDVDALSTEDIVAAEDLAALEVESQRGLQQSETGSEDDPILLGTADAPALDPASRRDGGDLYDDDRAFNEGQNWVEALEASAIENGPEPERELDDIVDDEDILDPPHASDTRDRPIADLGSGGRRGL